MTTLQASSRVAIQNILFATDFAQCSKAAVPYALAIAHQYGAKLYAAHILSPASYTFVTAEDWGALADQKGKQHQMDVALLEEHLRGVPHQVLSPVGEVVDVIFRLIRDHDIDLLVLGTHGRTGLPKLLMGSVAERIFRQASCPVLTVGPRVPPPQESVAEFNQILFATDFSDESLAALPHAISLAREHQARLSLLHVLERPEAGSVDLESNAGFLLRRLQELVPADSELWCHPEYFVEFGSPRRQILRFVVDHKVDLMVLGVRSAAGSMGAVTHLANSTAHQLVAGAGCPVLTVRG